MDLLPHDEPRPGAPGWVVTFADLLSLLLGFFVLLLSFSHMEIEKFRAMAGSMRDAFGLNSGAGLLDHPAGTTLIPGLESTHGDRTESVPQTATAARLRRALEASPASAQGIVEVSERGVSLRLSGDIVFDTGRTDLKPEVLGLLDRLVDYASTAPGTIEVEGHTDDLPIRSAGFPSNWELSAARAGAAVRYLSARGVPAARMKAIGYADTRPLAPNDSPANRARNRRIEILFVGAQGQRAT